MESRSSVPQSKHAAFSGCVGTVTGHVLLGMPVLAVILLLLPGQRCHLRQVVLRRWWRARAQAENVHV